MSDDLRTFIRSLPKTETHLHVEGGVPSHVLRGVDPVRFGPPPHTWHPDYRFATFAAFEEFIAGYLAPLFLKPEGYALAAAAMFERLVADNVKYAEVSFASLAWDFLDVPLREIAQAIKSVVPADLEVRLFMGMHHDNWTPKSIPVLEDALFWPELDGIDLHGPEDFPVRDWQRDYWPAARKAGKLTKAHAGELGGADHVRQVVEELGVRRVQHGFRAIEDDAVVQLCLDNDVAFDVCPISNVKLDNVTSMEAHPIMRLIERGITCTVNTDDPFVFGNERLEDDYLALAEAFDLNKADLAKLARNGFTIAACADERKSPWIAELDKIIADIA